MATEPSLKARQSAGSSSEHEYSEHELKSSKDAALKDGAFWAMMLGSGEAYVTPFALRLGAGDAMIGLIQSLPQFLGATSQLISLPLESRMKQRRIALTFAVFLQAFIWVPMALLAYFGHPFAVPLVFGLYCCYQIFGQAIAPIWSSWMAEIVRPNERGSYFAMRSQVAIFLQLAATLGAGFVLDHANLPVLESFALLFIAAFIARMISGAFLSQMSDKRQPSSAGGYEAKPLEWGEFINSPSMAENRRFSIYVGFLMAATHIASPFFDVYMLKVLHFDYTTWSIIVVAMPLAKFITYRYWGEVINQFGNRAVLFGTGFLVPAISLMWVFTAEPAWLFAAQLFSGLAWGGFELAAFNYTISNPDRAMRTAQAASYNFSKGTGTLLGSLVGGLIIASWPTGGAFGLGAFFGVFIISSLARYAASFYFLPKFSDKTFEGGIDSRQFMWQVLAVQPTRRFARHMLEISDASIHLARSGVEKSRIAAEDLGEKSERAAKDFRRHMKV